MDMLAKYLICFALSVAVVLGGSAGTIAADCNETENCAGDKQMTDSVESSPMDTLALSEVTVKARQTWIENGKVVMLPDRQTKKLAGSISDLINLMDINILKVKNGTIQTASGHPVNLFINGEPADKVDEKTFWARNVLRVEYMPSSGLEYEGKDNVVNLVMKEYTVGGLTEVVGLQTIPNAGYYSIASKLVVKKMTFNVSASSAYEKDYRGGSEGSEYYNGVDYDGREYDRITRYEKYGEKKRSNRQDVSMNARYRSGMFTATHSASFGFDRSPDNVSSGRVYYAPDIIEGDELLNQSSAKSPAVTVTGVYRTFTDKRKWMIAGNWKASYSRNGSSSVYAENPASAIVTDIKENVWSGSAGLNIGLTINPKMFTMLMLNGALADYRTQYTGTTDSRQHLRRISGDIRLQYNWRPLMTVGIEVVPRLQLVSRQTNGAYQKTEMLPGVSLQGYYDINDKSQISLYANCEIIPPQTSMTNDLILRQTELKWIEGTPMLDTQNVFYVTASYAWMPIDWFSTSLSGHFMSDGNESVLSYRAGGPEYDGVIGSYVSGLTHRQYNATWDATVRMFGGKLSLQPKVEYRYSRVESVLSNSNLSFGLRSSLRLGNFRIHAFYDSPVRNISDASGVLTKRPSVYGIGANYGNGNLIVSLLLRDVFRRRTYLEEYYDSPVYGYSLRNWDRGRYAQISVSYTFDYGKKVDPGIDIDVSTDRSTSVLGSKKL